MKRWPAFATLLASLVALDARADGAKKGDAQAEKLLRVAIDDDYLNVRLDEAEAKLNRALKLCGADRCSDEEVAKIHVGLATVHGLGQGKLDVAKEDFESALEADPDVELIEGITSKKLQAVFNQVIKEKHIKRGEKKPQPKPEEPEKQPSDEKPSEEKPSDSENEKSDNETKKPEHVPSSVEGSVGFEVSGYLDNTATEVLSPSVSVGVEDEVAGWGIEGNFMVDAVTAASTEIVATASPRWTDERYAPGLRAHFKAGDATINLGGSASVESDYIAGGASLGASIGFRQKTITPSLTYTFGYNQAGRRGTPYDVYERIFYTNALQLGIELVLDKSTILVPTFMGELDFGDSAKPYRYVPMFAPGTVIAPGASIAEVNAKRTDVMLEERLPQARQRYAVSALLAHRFTDVTLRLDERLYIDSWGLKASTTDFMLPIDAGKVFRFWPHLRFHAQTGVDFWQLAYTVKEVPGGIVATSLRTADRELGPLLGATFGGGFSIGSDTVQVGLSADAIYSVFLDHLYLSDRIAGLGTTTFGAKF